MEGRRNLIHLGVGIIMIASSTLAPIIPLYISLPLLFVGIFFVVWATGGSRLKGTLRGSGPGRLLIRAMDRVEALTETRDEIDHARQAELDSLWASLDGKEKSVLESLVTRGSCGPCTAETWQCLLQKNLVVGKFGDSAAMHITAEFSPLIAEKVRTALSDGTK